MRLSFSTCKPAGAPPVNFPGGLNLGAFGTRGWKEKVAIVIGATGAGKSRLSIDLARRFSAEVVNSDKMQVYRGLDIATNKVTDAESRGVPHHLLGIVSDPDEDFSAADFRRHASLALDSISGRGRLPIIAGGSNSYIESLVNGDPLFRSRYDCCFLWVHVSLPVLYRSVSRRVDRMVDAGLVDEVRGLFEPGADYSRGLRRAIGVPELDTYLRAEGRVDECTRERLLKEAIKEIKDNNCKLACKQLNKIRQFKEQWKANMHRLNATEVFLRDGAAADEAWEKLVLRRSIAILDQFLSDESAFSHPVEHCMTKIIPPLAAAPVAATLR